MCHDCITSKRLQRLFETEARSGLRRHACGARGSRAVHSALQYVSQEVILGDALLWHHVDQGPEGAILLSLQSHVPLCVLKLKTAMTANQRHSNAVLSKVVLKFWWTAKGFGN